MKLHRSYIKLTQQNRLHQLDIPVIGLTGGIACGKSTAASFLVQNNIPVIAADTLIKRIYSSKESWQFIQQNFPQCISEERIDFQRLRTKAFNDARTRQSLENFLYPQLPNAFKSALKDFSHPQTIVYDVPLLFEKSLNLLVDLSVCIYCNGPMQLKRLLERDRLDEDLAKKMLAEQMDIEVKRQKADVTIDNSGDREELHQRINEFIQKYLE